MPRTVGLRSLKLVAASLPVQEAGLTGLRQHVTGMSYRLPSNIPSQAAHTTHTYLFWFHFDSQLTGLLRFLLTKLHTAWEPLC